MQPVRYLLLKDDKMSVDDIDKLTRRVPAGSTIVVARSSGQDDNIVKTYVSQGFYLLTNEDL